MKPLLLTALIAASATTCFLLVQAQDERAILPAPRVVPMAAPPAQHILPQFLQEEAIALPANPHAKTRTFTNLDKMHDTYSDDFAKKPGFGYSRIMFLPPQDYLTLNGETYRFATPDLLGLEDEPLAYQRRGDETITMAVVSKKELRSQLQRRPLTAAELSAVAELRAGKSLVTLPKPVALVTEHGMNHVAGLLAVGALRAKAQCAECHQVKVGTLLGAFSYTLVPTNALTLFRAPNFNVPVGIQTPRPATQPPATATNRNFTLAPNISDLLIADALAARHASALKAAPVPLR